MLDYLHIENIAVAKDVDIDFKEGLNIISGETGSGKSIIIDSISFVLGSKVSNEIIRQGTDKAFVSAVFSDVSDDVYSLLDEYEIPYEIGDSISVSRSLSLSSKSIVKINSHTCTLNQLKNIGNKLVSINSQNENSYYTDKNNQIFILNAFCDIKEKLAEYSILFQKLNDIKSQIAEINELNNQKEMMLDILNFQLNEINSAKLKDINEEEKLNSLRIRLKDSEKITKISNTVNRALVKNESGISAVYLIDKAIEALGKLSDSQPEAKEMIDKLVSYRYEIADIAEKSLEFADIDGIDNPEKQLQIIDARLTQLQKLKKKYGQNIEQILKFRDEAEKKLNNLNSADDKLQDLKNEYESIYKEAVSIALDIHEERIKQSLVLSREIKESLSFLDMPNVEFKIDVKLNISNGIYVLDSNGADDVEFLIATNIGEEMVAMDKIASGGEVSRVMLALKSQFSRKIKVQTVIFDEIDTGVSGSTSLKVGIKLHDISDESQVICVTHSPQIASMATNHYFVKKYELNNRAESKVTLLNNEERILEIARIIGGINITDKQIDAAKSLINESKKYTGK